METFDFRFSYMMQGYERFQLYCLIRHFGNGVYMITERAKRILSATWTRRNENRPTRNDSGRLH